MTATVRERIAVYALARMTRTQHFTPPFAT
jgi:hypothetical protein